MKKKKIKNDIENKYSFKNYLFSFFIKSLIVVIFFLLASIYINISSDNKKKLKNIVYKNNLSFARIYGMYQKYLGEIIPFKTNNEIKKVSGESFKYNSVGKEGNFYLFKVDAGENISAFKSGIVIEKKKDKTYGNIVKIQDKQGVIITYGNLTNVSVFLYDYVSKDEIIGVCEEKVYLMFQKNGKYLKYDEFI